MKLWSYKKVFCIYFDVLLEAMHFSEFPPVMLHISHLGEEGSINILDIFSTNLIFSWIEATIKKYVCCLLVDKPDKYLFFEERHTSNQTLTNKICLIWFWLITPSCVIKWDGVNSQHQGITTIEACLLTPTITWHFGWKPGDLGIVNRVDPQTWSLRCMTWTT